MDQAIRGSLRHTATGDFVASRDVGRSLEGMQKVSSKAIAILLTKSKKLQILLGFEELIDQAFVENPEIDLRPMVSWPDWNRWTFLHYWLKEAYVSGHIDDKVYHWDVRLTEV